MKTPKYLITLSIGEIQHKEIWDTENSKHAIGYRLPWKLEKVQGRIHLRHQSGQAWEVNPDVISKGTSIELPQVNQGIQTPIIFRMKEANDLDAAFVSSSAAFLKKPMMRVVYSIGDWIQESSTVGGSFSGKMGEENLFTLVNRSGRYEVKLKDPLLQVEGNLAQGISGDDLTKIVIRKGSHNWRFVQVEESKPLADEDRPLVGALTESDNVYFRSLLRNGFGGVLVTLLVLVIAKSLFFEEEKEPEKQKFAKIQLAELKKGMKKAPEQVQMAAIPVSELPPQKPEPAKKSETKPEAPSAKPISVAQKAKAPPSSLTPDPARNDAKPGVATVAAPRAPAKPVVAAAVQNAMNLQKSLSGLFVGKSALTRANTIAKQIQNGGGASSQLLSGSSKVLQAGGPVAGQYESSNVNVAFTEGGGGYRSTDAAHAGVGGKANGQGGSFLEVGRGDPNATIVEDGLTKREVWEVISRHMSEVRHCYERAIIRRAGTEGKLVVSFSINPSGVVNRTGVKASTTSDADLDECVLSRLKGWKFPRPKGNTEVAVMYPFVFRRL